jgi:NAD(P)H-flavin reductase
VRAKTSGYFALASEVGAPSWELLVRMNGGASDLLLSAPEGAALDVVGPFGNGFPLDEAQGRPLILVVTGRALAVTRPILRARIARQEGVATSVYIGARTIQEVALAHEVLEWMHAGVRVVLCLSQHEAAPAWSPSNIDEATQERHLLSESRRARGYVQNILAIDVVERRVTEGLVFAAGPGEMLEELRRLQRTLAPKLEVITNV